MIPTDEHSKMGEMFGEPWIEEDADDEMQKHLHLLRWGCETFPDEDEDAASA